MCVVMFAARLLSHKFVVVVVVVVCSDCLPLLSFSTCLPVSLSTLSTLSNTLSSLLQLRRRLRNGGRGAFVETSLLRCGMWVNAPSILRSVSTKGATGAALPKYRVPGDRKHCYPAVLAAKNTTA